jgi:hypothetical protein
MPPSLLMLLPKPSGSGLPGLALEITDRLIAHASNLSGECVIPRLWKARGEALAALHREAEAEADLQAAQ